MNDILLTSAEGDVKITNGDFVIGNGDKQNIHDIINDAPGEWKQYPTLGVGIKYFLNSPVNNTQTLKNAIKNQLQSDGFNVSAPIVTYDYSTDKLYINPNATR